METFNHEITQVLKIGFDLSSEEVYNLLTESEKDSYRYTSGEIKIIFNQSANQNLTRKFNEDFKKDDKGKRREWVEIPEE